MGHFAQRFALYELFLGSCMVPLRALGGLFGAFWSPLGPRRVPEGSSRGSLGAFGVPRGASGTREEHFAQGFALYDLSLGSFRVP